MLYVHSITMIYHYLIILLFWVRVNPSSETVVEPSPAHGGAANPDTSSRRYPQNAGRRYPRCAVVSPTAGDWAVIAWERQGHRAVARHRSTTNRKTLCHRGCCAATPHLPCDKSIVGRSSGIASARTRVPVHLSFPLCPPRSAPSAPLLDDVRQGRLISPPALVTPWRLKRSIS